MKRNTRRPVDSKSLPHNIGCASEGTVRSGTQQLNRREVISSDGLSGCDRMGWCNNARSGRGLGGYDAEPQAYATESAHSGYQTPMGVPPFRRSAAGLCQALGGR